MTKRKRPMTRAEAAIKKRLFALAILETKNPLSRQEIIRDLGISEYTYGKWSADTKLVEWAGIEPWRYTEAARHFVRTHQTTALRTLVDVMQNSPNDHARVKAAETILSVAEEAQEAKSNANAEEVAKLLTSKQPVFVMGDMNFIHNQTTGDTKQLQDDGDVIEGRIVEPKQLPAASTDNPAS